MSKWLLLALLLSLKRLLLLEFAVASGACCADIVVGPLAGDERAVSARKKELALWTLTSDHCFRSLLTCDPITRLSLSLLSLCESELMGSGVSSKTQNKANDTQTQSVLCVTTAGECIAWKQKLIANLTLCAG